MRMILTMKWSNFITCLCLCVWGFSSLAANVLEDARRIGGFSDKGKAPLWDPMSRDGREYIGPLGSAPSALFCVDDSYPASINSEKDLWQLIWAMHKELKSTHYFEPGKVCEGKQLEQWMKRINTLRTLHVTCVPNLTHEGRLSTAIVVQYKSDMRIFAAFRNPKMLPQLDAKEVDVLDVCSQWIVSNIRKDMPNFLKIKKVHDAIVENTTYTRGYHNTPELILQGIGVCSAYTKACQLLLHMLKVDCRYAHGYVSTSDDETHAWNMVDVNGEWYHMDSTWDDPANQLSYTYFLINDEEMDIDHDWPFKQEDKDIYPTTPKMNALGFHKRHYFGYKDGQSRKAEDYYVDEDESVYDELFSITPEKDFNKLKAYVPEKELAKVADVAKKSESVVRMVTGTRPKKTEQPSVNAKHKNMVRNRDEFNKFIAACAEKLEGPKVSFCMQGGNTDAARNMVNASHIHQYVRSYSITSSEEHPTKKDPIITLTVEYWPHVRLLSASKNKEALTRLTPNENAALHACVKLAEAYGASWKLKRQKLRDAYEHLTSRVKYSDKKTQATDALLMGAADCLGYATTLHVLYSLMDIPSRIVFGRTKDSLHTWNMVRHGGKLWYHADSAMDASKGNVQEHRWKHFKETDDSVFEDRVWYLDEHPATPPGNPMNQKPKLKEIMKQLRNHAGIPGVPQI